MEPAGQLILRRPTVAVFQPFGAIRLKRNGQPRAFAQFSSYGVSGCSSLSTDPEEAGTTSAP